MQPIPGFNFRVLLSAPAAEDSSLEKSNDSLTAAGTVAASVVAQPLTTTGVIRAGFAEVTGLNSELEVEEYREGGRNFSARRFPKWGRYPNLVLRRGITNDPTLWAWWTDVMAHSYTLGTQSIAGGNDPR